jgi:hypothetical protein
VGRLGQGGRWQHGAGGALGKRVEGGEMQEAVKHGTWQVTLQCCSLAVDSY